MLSTGLSLVNKNSRFFLNSLLHMAFFTLERISQSSRTFMDVKAKLTSLAGSAGAFLYLTTYRTVDVATPKTPVHSLTGLHWKFLRPCALSLQKSDKPKETFGGTAKPLGLAESTIWFILKKKNEFMNQLNSTNRPEGPEKANESSLHLKSHSIQKMIDYYSDKGSSWLSEKKKKKMHEEFMADFVHLCQRVQNALIECRWQSKGHWGKL